MVLPALGILTLSAVSAAPAHAQTPSPLAEWQYSAGVALMPKFQPNPPDWQYTLGISSNVQPAYQGAKSYRVEGGPTFDIRYRDEAFVSDGEGLGVNLWHSEYGRAGLAVGYDRGRDEDDDGHLRGMGDIDPAPELKAFADIVVFPVVLRAVIRRAAGGANGWSGDISAYLPVAGSKSFFVFVGPSIGFADGNYMQTYFGVTPLQSARSGYRQYQADGGLKNVSFGTSVTWLPADHWLIEVNLAVQELMDSAADSPITANRFGGVGNFSIAYQF